jgi:hypothetical protein
MAANPKPPLVPGSDPERYHIYHAEAHVLSGNLKHPVDQAIEHHALVAIDKSRRAGHRSESLKETSVAGLITFKSGHSRVSGSQIEKKDLWGRDHSGWVTLSTSVIEGLNILEVITADRLVAQVSTEHPMREGHVPKVTFLGTRFENLRIGGHPVQLELDLGVCGDKPAGDRRYLEDRGFLDRVHGQLDSIAGSADLPKPLAEEYEKKIKHIDACKKHANGHAKNGQNGYSKVGCSLVKSIAPIPIPGVRIFGNLIFIPDFGIVSLADLEVGTLPSHDAFLEKKQGGAHKKPRPSDYFALSMINMRMGCMSGGNGVAVRAMVNGQTKP